MSLRVGHPTVDEIPIAFPIKTFFVYMKLRRASFRRQDLQAWKKSFLPVPTLTEQLHNSVIFQHMARTTNEA